MRRTDPQSTTRSPSLIVAMTLSAIVAILATIGALYAAGWLTVAQPSRQVQVHAMGTEVMPFDLNKTTHTFRMTASGGVQRVVAKDTNDAAQIALIQQHLQHEAMQFQAGDFADPMALHGADMPGLSVLQAGAAKISVTYMPLQDGAQLTYTTDDRRLITALHQWFGAQLSDHGQDATNH
jgi:hypothetical protein